MSKLIKAKTFNPKVELSELPIFRLSIGILLTLSFGIAVAEFFIFAFPDAMPSPPYSVSGLHYWVFDFFRIPVTLIALMLPVGGFIAAMHRSAQTQKQIEAVESQNNFSNYFKHIEEFEKYGGSLNEKFSYPLKDLRTIHRKFWPNVRSGDIDLDYEFIQSNTYYFSQANILFHTNPKDIGKTNFEIYQEIEGLWKKLASEFDFKISAVSLQFKRVKINDDETILVRKSSANSLIEDFKKTAILLIELLKFSDEDLQDELLTPLIEMINITFPAKENPIGNTTIAWVKYKEAISLCEFIKLDEFFG